MQKYVITGQIATIMLDRLREISNVIHKDDGPGEYTNRLLKDPGLTINEADGTVVVDLAKVKSPEIGMATMSTLGLKCTAMPQEIDKEFYDKLIEMDKNPAKKREYLQSIAPRISPDALRAAEMRLDDAIAHAKALEAKGKVYSSEQWNNTHVLRNMPRMKDGVTMELSYGYTEVVGKNIGIVKEYVENNTPSFFTRENFHKMFA